MGTPLLVRRRVFGAKTEVTVGTALTPSTSQELFNCFDLKIQPTIEFLQREGQESFSPLQGTLAAYGGTATFKTELYGGSSEPQLISVLLPACGFVGTSHVYSPVSQAPGTGNVTTLTIAGFYDGSVRQIHGAMGTAVFNLESGKPVSIDWTFHGVWDAPVDGSLPAPTFPTTAPIRFVSSGLTIASVAYRISKMSIDLGNQVVLREDSTNASGYISALISGRRIVGKIDPESTLVGTNDTYGDWLALSEGALAIALGTTGNAVAFAAPKLQFTNVQEGDRNKIQTDEIDFQLCRNASAGDDELTITLS